MSKAVVTGATSFIGQAVIRNLLKRGYEVWGLLRPNSVRNHILMNIQNPNFKTFEIEMGNWNEKLIKELQEADFIIHLGWNSNFSNPRFNLEGQLTNVDYFKNVVELARVIHCSKIVSVGSQAECGRVEGKISEKTPEHPETAYAIAKCKAFDWGVENCEKYNIHLCWPRLLSAYGPNDKERTMIMACIKAAVYGEEILFTPCEQIWDYIYVDDVAEALILIAQKGMPKVKYSVASGKGMCLNEYIKEIALITGNKRILQGIGKKNYDKNQVMYLVGDIRRLTLDTGFLPQTSFETGIKNILKENFNYYEN